MAARSQHTSAMGAVLVAVYQDHAVADRVRTQFARTGFPTDRVDLVSAVELGQAGLVPRPTVGEQLVEYFRKVFQTDNTHDEQSVQILQRAILEGRAAMIVQPRGDVETQSAVKLLREGDPVDVRAANLQDQALEQAATPGAPSGVTWIGKALAGPGARDTTGTPNLP